MTDLLTHSPIGPILIVGGYGTVGSALARLCAPLWPVLLTGRNPAKGQGLAAELGGSVRKWDLNDPEPFSAAARAVISTVNDPDDRVLRAAVRAGVPYVDVTRWTNRMLRAAATASYLEPTAPVLLSSGWMGGVVNIVAASLIQETEGVEGIEVAIRYDMNDQAGVDSVDFMDRLGQDFEVRRDGAMVGVSPLSGATWVDIGEHRTLVARLDTPEQLTLPLILGVDSVATRIGFSSNASSRALLAAKAVGFFRWGGGPRFTGLRRALLFSPGNGGTAMIRVDAHGRGASRSVVITDPAGQAHLTALGGYLGLQQVLAEGAIGGVVYPESRHDVAGALIEMHAHGVTVRAA